MLSAVWRAPVPPLALAAALAGQQAILTRAHEAEKLLQRQVARAQYDAAVATRRLRAVAPAKRHGAQT